MGYSGILPSYVGVILCHYKGPYYATSIMENKRSFSWLIVRNILRCCCNTSYMDDDEVCNGKCPSDVKEIQLSWMMIQAEICSISCFLDSKNIDHIGYQSGCHCLILCFGPCKILKVVNFLVCGPSDRFCWVLGIRWSNFSPSFEKHILFAKIPSVCGTTTITILKIPLHPGRLTAGTWSHDGLVQMMFLFNWVIVRFQPSIFRGVPVSESQCIFPPCCWCWWPHSTSRWWLKKDGFQIWLLSWNSKQQLGGGVKDFLFLPLFGEDSHFDSYFSDGLKPPTRQVVNGCLVIPNHFPSNALVHHPIETSIKTWAV